MTERQVHRPLRCRLTDVCERAVASEPRDRSEPAQRRARATCRGVRGAKPLGLRLARSHVIPETARLSEPDGTGRRRRLDRRNARQAAGDSATARPRRCARRDPESRRGQRRRSGADYRPAAGRAAHVRVARRRGRTLSRRRTRDDADRASGGNRQRLRVRDVRGPDWRGDAATRASRQSRRAAGTRRRRRARARRPARGA